MKGSVAKTAKVSSRTAKRKIVEISIDANEKEALCDGVAAKVRPIIDKLDLWRKNSLTASIRI